jgi:hypothetical protein
MDTDREYLNVPKVAQALRVARSHADELVANGRGRGKLTPKHYRGRGCRANERMCRYKAIWC